MYAFEKKIAELEMLRLAVSYPYQVIPLSDQGKLHFGIYNKKRGPIERIKDLFKNHMTNEKMEKFPFKGQIDFYYDDPIESEAGRIAAVKELARFNMARNGVAGISYKGKGIDVKPLNKTLREGEDYSIEVGAKIIHEYPPALTFDDVKSL